MEKKGAPHPGVGLKPLFSGKARTPAGGVTTPSIYRYLIICVIYAYIHIYIYTDLIIHFRKSKMLSSS